MYASLLALNEENFYHTSYTNLLTLYTENFYNNSQGLCTPVFWPYTRRTFITNVKGFFHQASGPKQEELLSHKLWVTPVFWP